MKIPKKSKPKSPQASAPAASPAPQQQSNTPAIDLEKLAREVLQGAFDLLQSKGWTSGVHCLDVRGQYTAYFETDVAKYDLYGAVMRAARSLKISAEEKDKVEGMVFRLLRAAMPGDYGQRGLVTFNCACSNVEQVLDVIRAAALMLDGKPLQERNARL